MPRMCSLTYASTMLVEIGATWNSRVSRHLRSTSYSRAKPKPPWLCRQASAACQAASEATWHAADACLQTHGGFGLAREYDVERKWRDTRLFQIAPISTNLILSYIGEHVLGMPRSY